MPQSATGFQQLTVSNAAVSLTNVQAGFGALGALITVEGADIRYRVDGSVPTATQGMYVAAGSVIKLESRFEVRNFRAIRAGAADAVLDVTYYG